MAEEPILSRIERLDNVLKQLEGTEVCGGGYESNVQSPNKSSTVSSTASSVAEQGCRPIEEVMTEAELKGTVIQRLANVEDRLRELCLHHHHHHFGETPKIVCRKTAVLPAETKGGGGLKKSQQVPKKGGFKSFVKSCMKTTGKGDHVNLNY
ncbi:unnamed protein product [Cuscuta campestris]|uniref:Uncharacterized protein n=2 Tax=Cuscuta sect. Cleistogrammica TaxID=1824901 RepID=A0A484LMX5_9ASTE|nr:hypothetical protein DM860_001196 [Cuscuta australis]VFQ77770.1 unnamed protein product [Cuscuta campestris]